MVLPTHSNGVPILSSQFAFLALQRLTCRPRVRKAQKEKGKGPSDKSLPSEPMFPIPEPPEPAFLPTSQPHLSQFFSISSLTSLPKRKTKSSTSLKPRSPPVDIVQTFFLPSELLHIIFTFALEPSSSDIDFDEKTALRVSILSFAQVCQQWRLAARDCRVLWPNAVDFQRHTPPVIADLLPLSRPHPIDVGHRTSPFRVCNQRDLAVLDLLTAESQRIREWNVEFPLPSRRSTANWDSAFPSAHQTSVRAVRYTGVTTPLTNLRTFSRTLHKLSIHDTSTVQPLQDSLTFSVLTELRISSVRSHSRPMEAEWFGILRNIPQLQLLALHDAIRLDMTAPLLPDFWLPRLRFLSLGCGDWVGACANIKVFQHLRAPDTCGTEVGFPSTLSIESAYIPRILDMYRRLIRERVGGLPGIADLKTNDTPQIEFGIRSTPTGCQLTFGTVRHPDLTLNWNGEHGSRGVIEYLEAHTTMFPKFPPLNIVVNDAGIADVGHAFELASDLFWRANSVKVHVEAETSTPAVKRAVSALPSLLSKLPKITMLKLDTGSSAILEGLSVLVPSATRPLALVQQFSAGNNHSWASAVLPNLATVVLELGEGTGGGGEVKAHNDAASAGVQKYATWRGISGFPIQVIIR